MKKFILIFIATIGLFFGLQNVHAALGPSTITQDGNTYFYVGSATSNSYTSYYCGSPTLSCLLSVSGGNFSGNFSAGAYLYFSDGIPTPNGTGSCNGGNYISGDWSMLGVHGSSCYDTPITFTTASNLSAFQSAGPPFYVRNSGEIEYDFYALALPTSISFVAPSYGTTTNDFANWNLAAQVTTSSDEYVLIVSYQEAGQIGSFFDTAGFIGADASTSMPFAKSQTLAQYETTSTWNAAAYLVDASMANNDRLFPVAGTIVATSSAILFLVSPAASANPSSTYPLYQYPSATIPFSPNTISTSTCNGWTDFGCEIGNVAANVLNDIFGINDNVVQNIAGFQLANTQPWSFVPEIENDFTAAASGATSTFATSTISFDLGHGAQSVPFFSAQSVHMFISDTVAAFIRSLIYLALVLALCFVVYVEIKHLFGHPPKT